MLHPNAEESIQRNQVDLHREKTSSGSYGCNNGPEMDRESRDLLWLVC